MCLPRPPSLTSVFLLSFLLAPTMPQIEPFHCLPPSQDVLLEIQVSSFIHDFLFPSVDDRKPSVVASSPLKTTPALPHLAVQSASRGRFGANDNIFASIFCSSPSVPDAFHRNAAVPVDIPAHLPLGNGLTPNACQSIVHGRCSTIPEEITINVREQEGNLYEVGTKSSDNQPSIASSEATSELCTSQSQLGRWVPEKPEKAPFDEDATNAQSSSSPLDHEAMATVTKMGSSTCKSKVQKERQLRKNDCEAQRQIKHSCRKPPRPPRTVKPCSQKSTCSGLRRCTSDTNVLLQSTRRAKTERKRKMDSPTSVTSMWALVFTLCFAIAIVVQGVLSQGRQSLAIEASNASSPANSYIKMKVPASATGVIPSDAQSGDVRGILGHESKAKADRERNIPIWKRFELRNSEASSVTFKS